MQREKKRKEIAEIVREEKRDSRIRSTVLYFL